MANRYQNILSITYHQGNADQNHKDITPCLLEWLLSRRLEITSIGKVVEKRKPLFSIDWCSHHGKQCGVSSKK